jgi:Tfp pilus assembly protein PilF
MVLMNVAVCLGFNWCRSRKGGDDRRGEKCDERDRKDLLGLRLVRKPKQKNRFPGEFPVTITGEIHPMDDQTSPSASESAEPDHPERGSSLSAGDEASALTIPEPRGVEAPAPPERRRRKNKDRASVFQRNKSNSRRERDRRSSKRGGGGSNERVVGRFLAIGSILLGLVTAFFAGVLTAGKSSDEAAVVTGAEETHVVLPTTEAAALLDGGFAALGGGNADKALLEFQKAQERQPALFGTDYLIALAAHQAGEKTLALQAAQRAVNKHEMEEEARVLIALSENSRGKEPGKAVQQLVDPVASMESAFRRYAALHPADPSIYCHWGDFLRSQGSYRSAADTLHRGGLRTDPTASNQVISAKESLARLQNDPSAAPPPLTEIGTMSGEAALTAACSSLRSNRKSDALLFLERAREFYSPRDFRELMNDCAFDEYRTDTGLKAFLAKISGNAS